MKNKPPNKYWKEEWAQYECNLSVILTDIPVFDYLNLDGFSLRI